MVGKRILGIDPGQTGALAFLNGSGEIVELEDMPLLGKKEVNAHMITRLIQGYGPVMIAVVEAAQSMPKQGVAGVFSYGVGYGKILGVLAALDVPIELVAPGTWKKAMGLNTDKSLSRAKATRRWPTYADNFKRVKDDGRAEAALLAAWWASTHTSQPRVIRRLGKDRD